MRKPPYCCAEYPECHHWERPLLKKAKPACCAHKWVSSPDVSGGPYCVFCHASQPDMPGLNSFVMTTDASIDDA